MKKITTTLMMLLVMTLFSYSQMITSILSTTTVISSVTTVSSYSFSGDTIKVTGSGNVKLDFKFTFVSTSILYDGVNQTYFLDVFENGINTFNCDMGPGSNTGDATNSTANTFITSFSTNTKTYKIVLYTRNYNFGDCTFKNQAKTGNDTTRNAASNTVYNWFLHKTFYVTNTTNINFGSVTINPSQLGGTYTNNGNNNFTVDLPNYNSTPNLTNLFPNSACTYTTNNTTNSDGFITGTTIVVTDTETGNTSTYTITYNRPANPATVGISDYNSIVIENIAYPNPSKDIVTIKFNTDITNSSLELYNTSGEKLKNEIKQNSTHEISIETNDLAKGSYFVKYNNQTIKFIKE